MSDRPVLTYKGKPPKPQTLVELWTTAERRFPNRDDRICKSQALVRGTETVTLDATFLKNHPEIDAEHAVSMLPEREAYLHDLVTKAAAIEPKVSREPLDVNDTARDAAEEYESYMREVATDDDGGVPYEDIIGKLAHDGEHGLVAPPAHLDRDGIPDFYDRLSERAVARMTAEQRRAYTPDENRVGYASRKDERGRPRYNPKYERDAKGRTREEATRADGKGTFARDRDKSKAAHEAAVRRYLLAHQATNFRIIPALDCYPLLGSGKGRRRWAVEGLIERSLLEREELVERDLGWAMLGDRLLLPRGASRTHAYAATRGPFYLYTAYLMLRAEDADGVAYRPCILYTVGGAATWWDGMAPPDAGLKSSEEVAIIDLFAEFKLTAPCWTYEFGTHTFDDDPNYYGRPAIWQFRRRILNIEQIETANHVTVAVNAYSGHYYKPDAKLLEVDPEAVVEPETHTLRKPVKPGPGDIEPYAGDVVPFQQSQIGQDAWRQLANYQASLQAAMATEDRTAADASGHAMLVAGQQGQVQKSQIRNAALRLYRFCLEADARNRLAAYKCHGVKWPIMTTKERPVGHDIRAGRTVVEFDPAWLGEDENVKLTVTYGAEFNLAKADQEMAAAERGFRALEHVAAAFGEDDTMNLRVAIATDALWKMPENQQLLISMVDKLRGMTRQRQAALLQSQQRMTQNALPGAPIGLPAAMLRRAGEQMAQPRQQGAPGGGQPSIGASVRGGIVGAEKTGAAMAANAAGQFGQNGQGVA